MMRVKKWINRRWCGGINLLDLVEKQGERERQTDRGREGKQG